MTRKVNNPTQTFRFYPPTGSNRYNGRTVKFILCQYKCIIRSAAESGQGTLMSWKRELGSSTAIDFHMLGGYASNAGSGGGPVNAEIIWIDALSRWMVSAPNNRLLWGS